MANLLPAKPLKWIVFILLVVVVAEAFGVTAFVQKTISSLKSNLAGK